MKTNDILVSTWGWEQTNVSFYRVLKTSASSAWLVQLGVKKIYTSEMAGIAEPLSSNESPNVLRRKIKTSKMDGRQYVLINEYADAEVWNGKPESFTCYA